MNLHGMHEIVVSGHDCLCVVRGMCSITTGQCEGEAVLHLEGGAHAGLGIPGGVFDSSSNK